MAYHHMRVEMQPEGVLALLRKPENQNADFFDVVDMLGENELLCLSGLENVVIHDHAEPSVVHASLTLRSQPVEKLASP